MTVSPYDHCGHCGLPLRPLPDGTRLACCGPAYWSKRLPKMWDRAFAPLLRLSAQEGGWALFGAYGLPEETKFILPHFGKNDGHAA
jgi:hypothetical protein